MPVFLLLFSLTLISSSFSMNGDPYKEDEIISNKNIKKIDHFIVFMMENRSFDHIFGHRKGVNGLKGGEYNLLDSEKSESSSNKRIYVGEQAPYSIIDDLSLDLLDVGDPYHTFEEVGLQLYGNTQRIKKETTNNGFVKSYIPRSKQMSWIPCLKRNINKKLNKKNEDLSGLSTQSFKPEDLPVINGLADHFVLCDNFFCDLPGPTEVNRHFLHAATSAGYVTNTWASNFILYRFYKPCPAISSLKTIYDQISEKGMTWSAYYHDVCDLDNYATLKNSPSIKRIDQFKSDVKQGKLAHYVFIQPRMFFQKAGPLNAENPPLDIRYGEHLIADIYETLRSNEDLWNRSALILTYDEHGGFYDHVFPPQTQNPDGLFLPLNASKSEKKTPFDFKLLGARVPALVISPWVPKGMVCSDQLQNTSIMKTARELFHIVDEDGKDIPLTKRDEAARSFANLFSLKSPRKDCPLTLTRPDMPTSQKWSFLKWILCYRW